MTIRQTQVKLLVTKAGGAYPDPPPGIGIDVCCCNVPLREGSWEKIHFPVVHIDSIGGPKMRNLPARKGGPREENNVCGIEGCETGAEIAPVFCFTPPTISCVTE